MLLSGNRKQPRLTTFSSKFGGYTAAARSMRGYHARLLTSDQVLTAIGLLHKACTALNADTVYMLLSPSCGSQEFNIDYRNSSTLYLGIYERV